MKEDYILISKGSKGTFTLPFSTLAEAVNAGAEELKQGQTCSLYQKHADLLFESVTVVKSEIQKDLEKKKSEA